MPSLQDLLADPLWFPASMDAEKNLLNFLRVTRKEIEDAAFLDERLFNNPAKMAQASLSDVLAANPKPGASPPCFIFHSAFCCSTLLARALDFPDVSLSLKEPKILMDFANAIRVSPALKQSPAKASQLFTAILALLSRPMAGAERVVIKPTNTANNLVGFVRESGSKTLFLYGPLRDFMISLLKKGEEGRAFARRQYNIFVFDPLGLEAIPPRQAMSFTDLQTAALVWRAQLEQFQSALALDASARALNFHSLLKTPATLLAQTADHFHLQIDADALVARADGDLFRKNAKFSDQQFSTRQRAVENESIDRLYKDDLDAIEKWAGALSLQHKFDLPLSPDLAAS